MTLTILLAALTLVPTTFAAQGTTPNPDPTRFAAIVCAGEAGEGLAACPTPKDKAIAVLQFTTGGSGTAADPWTGWEPAFGAIDAEGAVIEFAPGHYKENTAIMLPVDLVGWLLVTGNGATIHLTAAAPRFLTPNLTADHQTVRHIRIQDFEIDAAEASGKNSVIFGNYVNGSGNNGIRRVNWDQVVVKRVRAYGLAVDRTTKNHLGGLNMSAVHAGDAESVRTTTTNIYIEDVRIEGGNWGILVDGGGPGIHTNIDIDNVWLVRCWHSLMSRPPTRYPSSNFQVGERGRVGHVFVIDSYGQYSADSGLELNNVAHGVVTNTVIEDALVGGFYYVNYTVPSATPQVTWDRCKAAVTGSLSSSPYGSGWFIPVGTAGIPAGGDFVISHSTFARLTDTYSTVGAAVSMVGAHGSLTLVGNTFSWLNADLDLGSAQLVQLAPSNDFKLTVRGVELALAGRRSEGRHGLTLLALQASGKSKTITLDVRGVHGAALIVGTSVDGTIAAATFAGAATDKIAGSFSDSHFGSRRGDPEAVGVKIDLTHLRVDPNLELVALDGSSLPAGGRTVALDNAPSVTESAKVRRIGVVEPGDPAAAIEGAR